MILVRILYEELQREIVQKQEKLEGLDSLGIRDRKVELVAPPVFYLCKV
jgi:hypothetical protein